MDVSHVYDNRDLLKDCHARGGAHAPGSATYICYPMITNTPLVSSNLPLKTSVLGDGQL